MCFIVLLHVADAGRVARLEQRQAHKVKGAAECGKRVREPHALAAAFEVVCDDWQRGDGRNECSMGGDQTGYVCGMQLTGVWC